MYPTKLNDGKLADFVSHRFVVYHPSRRFHTWYVEPNDSDLRFAIAKLNSRAKLDSTGRPVANYRPIRR